jgi:hypothetical protein
LPTLTTSGVFHIEPIANTAAGCSSAVFNNNLCLKSGGITGTTSRVLRYDENPDRTIRGGLDRITYLERKRVIFEKRPWQRVRINEVLWVAEHGSPDSILVRFLQEYDSPQGGERSRKEQRWIRTNQRWQLASESELPSSEIDATKAKPRSGTGGASK